MQLGFRRLVPFLLGASALGILVIGAGAAGPSEKDDGLPVKRVVMFASDGMRPDLMEKYAKDGAMPTYKELMKKGITGDNGMTPAFPPNTGVGWYTMATGTYPSEHGSTNNTYFRAGDCVLRTARRSRRRTRCRPTRLPTQRSARARRSHRSTGSVAPLQASPGLSSTSRISSRTAACSWAWTTRPSMRARRSSASTTRSAPISNASGWTNVPAGDPAATPKQTTWLIRSTFAAQNPNRTYNVYFYDSQTGGGVKYDRAIVSPVGKTGSAPSITLKVGDFLPVKLTGADGLIGTRATQTVGHYIKLISLAPNLSDYKLYDTSLARAIATCGAVCNGLPAGAAGEDRLEKYIADNLLPWAAADFAPEEAGVIDEDTYVQQGRDLERAYSLQVINYILGTLQPNTDFAMVGYPFTDEVSHQFLGLTVKTDADGGTNPCYDVTLKFSDTTCVGLPKQNRVKIREDYIKSAYADADEKLGKVRAADGRRPDDGRRLRPRLRGAVVRRQRQRGAEPGHGRRRLAARERRRHVELQRRRRRPGRRRTRATDDIAKACWAGGTTQIYINPNRLKNAGQPATATFPTYEEARTAIRNAFSSLTDPANPGKQVILKIMNKEELRNVDGSDSLHPSRSGDVVVVSRPPYQWDAPTANQKIALSRFFGQHGYLPNTVDVKNSINMHATFVAGGPGFKDKKDFKGVRQIDLAPTLAFMMGIPGPQQARGAILYDAVKHAENLNEITILDISDWHAQLTPLAEVADTVPTTGAVNPSFAIGGAAFLKTWFDIYEGESALTSRDKKSRASSRSPPATPSAAQRLRSRTSSATSPRLRSWG